MLPELLLSTVEKHWGIITAIGAGSLATKRWLVPRLRVFNSAFERVAELPEKVDKVVTKVDELSQNVTDMKYLVTNNGKTGLLQMVALIDAKQRLSSRNDATWQASSSGQNTKIGIGFTELLGWKSEDMIGDGWIRMLPPDRREDYLQAWENAVEQNVPFVYPREGTIKFRCANGTWKEVTVTAMPTYHEIDGEISWVGVIEEHLPCVVSPNEPLCGRKP